MFDAKELKLLYIAMDELIDWKCKPDKEQIKLYTKIGNLLRKEYIKNGGIK